MAYKYPRFPLKAYQIMHTVVQYMSLAVSLTFILFRVTDISPFPGSLRVHIGP